MTEMAEDMFGYPVHPDDWATRHVVEHFLKPAIIDAGNQAAFAKRAGVSPAYVSDVMRGNRAPGDKILDALNLERVYMYKPKRR